MAKVTHTESEIDFEWDSEKAKVNEEKHKVACSEAAEVFLAPFVQVGDVREVEVEAREAAVGMSKKWRVLYVAYVWRRWALRIISARRATKPERNAYEDQ